MLLDKMAVHVERNVKTFHFIELTIYSILL